MGRDKRGVSAKFLQRELGVACQTAWTMAHKLRHGLSEDPAHPLHGFLEADETFIGGRRDPNSRGRSTKNPDKSLVVAAVEKPPAPKNRKGKHGHAVSRSGSITLVSGLAGQRASPGRGIYAGVLGGIEGMVKSFAAELRPVRVNGVCAGAVDTELWQHLPEAERLATFARLGARLPVGRVGKPEDIAEAYLYLMKTGFSTGETIVLDGGALQAP